MPLLITNATLVTHAEDGLLEDHAVYIAGDTIADIGPAQSLGVKYPEATMIDARGGLVMPGNICAHTHFYGAFSRGMPIPGAPPEDFPAILRRLWWSLDRALDPETIRLSALVCLIDAVKHGTTLLFDHHASPNAIDASLDVIAGAVDEAGLRAVLCYEVTDRNGPDGARAGITENRRFLRKTGDHPRVKGVFGLHASFTLSPETLAECVEAARDLDTGFHIHVAEHPVDEYDSLQRYGKRVVPRLQDAGVLGPKSIVAHAVHCNAWELEILRDTGTWITHQPRSNMNNGVGAAPLDTMLAGDLPVCLGNDGLGNNMWAEWKTAYFLQKVAHHDPRRAPGDGIARMAWHNNARLAARFFPGQVFGTLAVGAAADLIVVDYDPFTPLTAGNLPWHVVFGFEASMVNTTIVAGRILMQNRQLLTLDEEAINARARAVAPDLWARYTQIATSAR